MEQLAHKELTIRFTQFIHGYGWRKVKNKEYSFNHIYPDGVYKKINSLSTQRIIVAEVKTKDASQKEILKGIGQCARYLSYKNVVPYFILPVKWFDNFQDTFRELPWLGIVTFNGNGDNMRIEQKSNR